MSSTFAMLLLLLSTFGSVDDPTSKTNKKLIIETADNLILKDDEHSKELHYKVYYPNSGGPYPVILFSHGFGGTKDSFSTIGKQWASEGYVVIHPTHADGMPRTRRIPIGGFNPIETIAARVGDLTWILDSLDKLHKQVPGLKGKLDTTIIGVGGHSFGAYTAMLIGGVTADLGNEKQRSFHDKRVQAILPISAQGTGQQGLTKKSWDQLTLPMMTITGTRDRGAGQQSVDWKKEPYQYSPPGDKYLIVIEGANHFSFGGRAGIQNQPITDAVTISTTLFWNAYLKNDVTAKKQLKPANLKQLIKVNCDFEAK